MSVRPAGCLDLLRSLLVGPLPTRLQFGSFFLPRCGDNVVVAYEKFMPILQNNLEKV